MRGLSFCGSTAAGRLLSYMRKALILFIGSFPLFERLYLLQSPLVMSLDSEMEVVFLLEPAFVPIAHILSNSRV